MTFARRLSVAQATHPKLATAFILLLFLLPSLVGVGQHIFGRTHYWFRHYEAVACAGQKAAQDQPLYDLNIACEGMRAVPYAYPPLVAEAMEKLQKSFGMTGATALYGGLFWAAAGFLLWAATFSRHAPGTVWDRAPYLAMHTGYALFWGNIAILVHGAVAATAVLAINAPWALAGVIALGGTIKPVFLTYAIVLLYAAQPPLRRLAHASIAVVAGLAPTLWFLAMGGDEATQWKANVAHFVLSMNSGASFFNWAVLLGADPRTLPVMASYLLYAAILAGAGLVIAETSRLNPLERVWLGLTVATLLNPRLFAHDVLLLGPGMVVATASAKAYSSQFGARFQTVLISTCLLVLALTLLGGRLGQNLGTFAFATALIVLGAARLRAEIRQYGWQYLWQAPRAWFPPHAHNPG